MTTLEQNIEQAAATLPHGRRIKIEIENGYGGVIAIRPDGAEVNMDTGENCLAEQVAAALHLTRL